MLVGDVFGPDWDDFEDMDGNDIYLRWAAAQYVGHLDTDWEIGYHQFAWVGGIGPSGYRDLRIAQVRDYDPLCEPLRNSEMDVATYHDVNWVHRGGFVPYGHADGAWYVPHGYLVWSGRGEETVMPRVEVGRFDLGNYGQPPYIVPMRTRNGILPAMASNRPFHFNKEINWETGEPIEPYYHVACPAPPFNPRCDSGQLLLLVYSGDLTWRTLGYPLDDFSYDPHWLGTSIRYVLMRPGDYHVFAEGVLADVTLEEGYDPEKHHAIYPEVVWDASAKVWIVTWQEKKRYFITDPEKDTECAEGAICWGVYRYARTVDQDGNLGPVRFLGRCSDSMQVTQTGDDPDPLPRWKKSYCYFLNAANDHYGMEYEGPNGTVPAGIPMSDRNHDRLSLHDSYKWELHYFPEPHIPRWFQMEIDPYYKNNLYPYQPYDGSPHVANITVIDWWETADFGYDKASYIMFSYDRVDQDMAVQNRFFFLKDSPNDTDQSYNALVGNPDYSCTRRVPWASSSALGSFVAFWTQYNPSTQTWEAKYGNYYFVPE